MTRTRTPAQDEQIDITPMLDIVFILLIFFIVTTSFTKESGIAISGLSRSEQQTVQTEPPALVRIDALGRMTLGQRAVSQAAMRANLERLRALNPNQALVIAAHPDAPVDTVVTVLDAARLARIASVQVAASSA